ncbi:hypothetical protein ACPF7Z_00080 [Halomonas sp. GXIMD04776]|uniref:hypothetical protein n=1 Tax=Halomonas sp. GXIMD04776 TaxID=3415605 RepID=UPI003CB0FF43
MKIAILTASLLASLLLTGSALAMDSVAIQQKMAEISQQTEQATKSGTSRVEALEQQVAELEELIRMMAEEEQG